MSCSFTAFQYCRRPPVTQGSMKKPDSRGEVLCVAEDDVKVESSGMLFYISEVYGEALHFLLLPLRSFGKCTKAYATLVHALASGFMSEICILDTIQTEERFLKVNLVILQASL